MKQWLLEIQSYAIVEKTKKDDRLSLTNNVISIVNAMLFVNTTGYVSRFDSLNIKLTPYSDLEYISLYHNKTSTSLDNANVMSIEVVTDNSDHYYLRKTVKNQNSMLIQ